MLAFPDVSFLTLCVAVAVALVAGVIKGVSGFALPMILVSGMVMIVNPQLAIASMVVPTIVTNFWQVFATGARDAAATFFRFRVLILTTLAMIFIHAQWIGGLPLNALLIILGAAIVCISVVQLLGVRIQLSSGYTKISAFIAGQVAGFFGAIAGTWGPPTVIYLLAINTHKKEQVRVSGITFGLGAVMFGFAHLQSGIITAEAMGLSLFLTVPCIIGLLMGMQIQDRIDQKRFRYIILIVLLIAGLSILRKAILG